MPPSLAPGVDAVIVAGDVGAGGDRGLAYLRRHLGPSVPVVFVMGNREREAVGAGKG